MVVISGTKANLLPTEPPVERDGCGIWLSHLEKNCSLRLGTQDFEKGGSDTVPAERGIDGEVEKLGFAGGGPAPGAETGDGRVHQCHQ